MLTNSYYVIDSLTQIILGAAVGEAVLGKKVGNRAMLWGAIAGTIPDLDVVGRFLTDTITATEMHRGFSHSLVFSMLMAPILGWLVHQIEKRGDVGWRGWSKLFFWGLFTHPLLDAFTTWGTQIFWPFNWRIALNSIFVIDPLYTLPFLVCLIIAMGYNYKGNNIPAYREVARRVNKRGIYLSTGYLLLTLFLKWAVHHKLIKALEKQNVVYTEISTRPSPLNTILWNVNVDTEDTYLIGDYSFFDTHEPIFKIYPKNRLASREIDQNRSVQRLINISEGWYITSQEEGRWYFNDLRFGLIPIDPKNPQFVFRYALKIKDGDVFPTEDRPKPEDRKAILGTLWERIKGK